MTRGQWIALIILVFLVLIAIVIGIILWMRNRNVVVVEAVPNNSLVAPVTPVVGTQKTHNLRPVKKPTNSGATYREILGKRS